MKKSIFLFISILSLAVFITNVMADVVSGELEGYYSASTITTQGTSQTPCTVESGKVAVLEATTTILLSPYFHAKAGSRFYAIIGQNGDNDSDTLYDWWELLYLGLLDYGPDDDPEGDGMSNKFEFDYGFDPMDPVDADQDLDGDGYSNYLEFVAGTDPDDDEETPSSGTYNQYDVLGRLKKTLHVSGMQIQYEIEYEYDTVGNRTTKIIP